MESAGKGSDDVVKQIREAVEETKNGNASASKEGEENRADPKLGALASKENSSKKSFPGGSNENEDGVKKKMIESTDISRDNAKTSAAVQKEALSIPDNSKKNPKDSKDKPQSVQQTVQQQRERSTRPSSPQQEQPQNLKRKRPWQQVSPPQTGAELSQNLTKTKIDNGTVSDIWTRYDLTRAESTTPHETAELKAVEKQIWKRKTFVPYTGLNSFHSSSFLS